MDDYAELKIGQAPPAIPSTSDAHVLVLSCIDPRFTEYLAWFMEYEKKVYSVYDHFSLAGASLGVNQARSPTPTYAHWNSVFMDHVKLGLQLHTIDEVWVIEHLDCGAYKQIKSLTKDDQIQPHKTEMENLQTYLKTYTSSPSTYDERIQNLAFKGFVISKEGAIYKVIDDGEGVELMWKEESTRNWIGPAVVVTIFLFALLVGLKYITRK